MQIISILLLSTPILNQLSLYIFKTKYIGFVIKIIHIIILILSVFLMYKKIEFSFMLFFCNLLSFLLLIASEKVYNVFVNIIFSSLFSQLADAEVISTILFTPKNAFALSTIGYVMINFKNNDYKISKDIQEFSENEQKN